MAFLQRMKSICSKLATPATSRSIAFTALVTNDETESRWDRQWGDEPRYPPPYPFVGHLAEFLLILACVMTLGVMPVLFNFNYPSASLRLPPRF